jgi:SAM-dependent methyltransferase
MKQPCQLCGASDFITLMHVDPANFSSRIVVYDIVRCTACGLATMDPFPSPSDIEELYVRQNVFSRPYDNPFKNRFLFSTLEPLYREYGADDRFIARTCLRLAPHAQSVLDVGCSTGAQLTRFVEWQPRINVTGIDIDPQARDRAHPEVRPNIVIGNFLEHAFERPFDIVVMKFVIEHVLDLPQYIRKGVGLLARRGVLFIGTPDIDSRKARQLKQAWPLINDPRVRIGHLRWFNRGALNCLAQTFGLRILKVKNRGESFYYFPESVQRLLVRLLGRDESGRRFIKHYAPRITYALLFDCWLSQLVGYGDSIYAFLGRRDDGANGVSEVPAPAHP